MFRLVSAPALLAASLLVTSPVKGDEVGPKVYVGSDGVTENFGAREAPYAGFLYLPQSAVPGGYNEISHHYTKTEYLVTFRKVIGSVRYSIDVTESNVVKFFEPHQYEVAREFVWNGQAGRVLSYREHLTDRQAMVLYWMNPPKQRISIDVESDALNPISPDELIGLLVAMKLATTVPALVNPFPRPTPGRP